MRLGKGNNDRFVVLAGPKVGDKIVTDGSLLLRAERLKQNRLIIKKYQSLGTRDPTNEGMPDSMVD